MNLKKTVLRYVMCLSLLLAFSFALLPQMAQAASGAGWYFNGGVKNVVNNGAAATIETQNPYVYTGYKYSCSCAWAMTCDRNADSGGRYAQVGYTKEPNTSKPYYFYEYSYDDDWTAKTLSTSPSVGSHHTYMVGCDSKYMYFKIDGTSQARVPLTKIPFSRNKIEIFTETHHTSDQSLGSAANPVTMGACQYKSVSNTWTSTKCVRGSSSAGVGYGTLTTQRNNIPSSGASSWEVWDSRY